MRTLEAIQRGARLLDEQKPGWENLLTLDSLNLAICRACVLGQLYGTYGDGKDALGIIFGRSYGFSANDEDYPKLTRMWRRFVARRITKKVARFLK